MSDVLTRKSFGQGLNAVLNAAASLDDHDIKKTHQALETLMVQQLMPGAYQPRKKFDDESLQELSQSIKEKGIIQPIIVRRAGRDYEIIAGGRRWRAAQIAGFQQVPVVICDISNEAALAFSLIENIQRKNLNPLEEAEALKRLIDEFNMTHERVAESIGRSRSAVTNLLRLLGLQPDVQKMLCDGLIEMGHARALLSLDESQQVRVAKNVVDKVLSVRDAEKMVQQIDRPYSQKEQLTKELQLKSDGWKERLTNRLNSKVKIQVNNKGQGRVSISFDTIDEVDWLVSQLEKE